MKWRDYAARLLIGCILLVAGIIVGLLLPRRSAAPVANKNPVVELPSDDSEPSEAEEITEILLVLSSPEARRVFNGAVDSKTNEIELITTSSRSSLRASQQALFDSVTSPKEFSQAMVDVEKMEQCGLLSPRRRSRSGGREVIVYALTPRGHQISELLK